MISTTNRILLFYNAGTGAAATGRIDEEGKDVDLGAYRFDPGWRFILPTMDGHLLFFSGLTGTIPSALLGRIDAQGAYRMDQ